VASALQARLAQASALYEADDLGGASDEMVAFAADVKAHSGEEIPDLWQAGAASPVNVAGLLRSAAETLKFSLDRKSNQ
jgi:hypothetical protein